MKHCTLISKHLGKQVVASPVGPGTITSPHHSDPLLYIDNQTVSWCLLADGTILGSKDRALTHFALAAAPEFWEANAPVDAEVFVSYKDATPARWYKRGLMGDSWYVKDASGDGTGHWRITSTRCQMTTQLNLHIETMDTAAFHGCAREECADILEAVARILRDPDEDAGELSDTHGNSVGFWYADFPRQEDNE